MKLRTNPIVVNELLRFLTDEAASLESLSLVQMGIPSTTMPLIVAYMETNCTLEALDLSWNDFKPQDFIDLMNCL